MAADPNGPPERILIVEDDRSVRDLLVDELSEAGYTTTAVGSAEEAERSLERFVPDLIVSDLRLPGADGRALLHHAITLRPRPAFLLITAFGTVEQAVESLRQGADDFLVKPLDLDHLRVSVARALETRRLRSMVRQYEELLGEEGSFQGMVGRSKPMRDLFNQIRHIARAKGPVLVVGESGVGKEMVARALHLESERSHRPFVPINAAGIPGELLESEIFGHESGAFTGATRSRKGLFEEASGGTLFLDEIGEMPMALQAKLLRVLQDGRVRPVGSNRERAVDVRIIAATNRDLAEAVRDGSFREDLYYRLETFILNVPPLREREGDIEMLVARFLKVYGQQMGREVSGLSSAALQRVKEYPFPGNVRELQNTIERAVAFCDQNVIKLEHLPTRLRQRSRRNLGGSGTWSSASGLGEGALPTLAEMEARYIDHVLETVDGNKRQAAKLLGISRRTLYRRLEDSAAGLGGSD